MNFNRSIPDLSNSKILVCGDIILDKYWHGPTNRISPEAPVPVVKIDKEEYRLGGAANVACNLSSIGCNATLIGFIGDDFQGKFIVNELKKKEINNKLIIDSKYKTTTKLRVISRNMQLIRLDFEEEVAKSNQNLLIEKFQEIVKDFDLVIFSDYAKGALLKINELIKICFKYKIKTLVDPKQETFEIYKGATFLKPNLSEFIEMVGKVSSEEELRKKAFNLIRNLNLEALIVTKGSSGISLYKKDNTVFEQSASASEVFDVTGAGDTVLAVLGAFLACGSDIKKSIYFANKAAGLVVGKSGTSYVSIHDLHKLNLFSDKILTIKQLEKVINIERVKEKDLKIVFTNGCFDIIHAGHINYLKSAKKLGDILVLALNSDASVKKLKGENRPINKLEDRIAVLSAFDCVDYLIVFNEDTPLKIIQKLKPDILVKGSDYNISQIAGAEFTINNGGMVQIIDLTEDLSTTKIIQKLKSL